MVLDIGHPCEECGVEHRRRRLRHSPGNFLDEGGAFNDPPINISSTGISCSEFLVKAERLAGCNVRLVDVLGSETQIGVAVIRMRERRREFPDDGLDPGRIGLVGGECRIQLLDGNRDVTL